MVSLKVEIQDTEAADAFNRLIADGEDLSPVMDQIGAMLVASTQLRFERGVGPDGQAWPPSIRVQREGGQTLVLSGRLSDSITHDSDADSVTVGTNVIYAPPHQFGATIRAKNADFLAFKIGNQFVRKREVTLPARPFIGIGDGDADEIVAIVADHLDGVGR